MGAFDVEKKKSLPSLKKALQQGEVDEKIISTLESINAHADYFTTSSCGGRISLSVAPLLGKKKDHEFVKKWHGKITLKELIEAIPESWSGLLWLKTESFILHVGCRDMGAANNLQKLAIKLGLKRSGVFRINPFPMVEIIATDYISVPLGEDGRLFVDDAYLSFLLEIMNARIEENDKKLMNFTRAFVEELS